MFFSRVGYFLVLVNSIHLINAHFQCPNSTSDNLQLIQLNYLQIDDISNEHLQQIKKAQCLWNTILSRHRVDLPDYTIRVDVNVTYMDGVSGNLAKAGPTVLWITTKYKHVSKGIIVIDIDDLQNLSSDTIFWVTVHEIAHVLGFIVTWPDHNLSQPGLYYGKAGLQAYRYWYQQPNAAYIPLLVSKYESQTGHWLPNKEVDKLGRSINNEVMVHIMPSKPYLSPVSIATMLDLGYKLTDQYCHSNKQCRSGKCNIRLCVCYPDV